MRMQPPACLGSAGAGRERIPAGWPCRSAACVTQCRDGGRWLGLCHVPGGSRDSGKSRYGGGQQEASARPWPAASQLAHVSCQPPQRAAAPTPGSAWRLFTISQLCPRCPLGVWQHLAAEERGGCLVRADTCLVWAVTAQTGLPRWAQESISTSIALGTGVRADMSQPCTQAGSGVPEELGNAASP